MTDKEKTILNKTNRKCKYYHPNNKCGLKACCMLNAKKCNVNADYCQLKLREYIACKEDIINSQYKTIEDLTGCVSLWEVFTDEELKLAKNSSIADLIILLRNKDERIRELEIKLKHKKNSYKREKEVKELSISRWEEDVESYEKKLSQIVELTDKTENIYEVLKDMDFEKRSRFFIARTSNNTKNDLWEFKNFIFSFIQPIYEQHVKHLQQIKQIVQGE